MVPRDPFRLKWWRRGGNAVISFHSVALPACSSRRSNNRETTLAYQPGQVSFLTASVQQSPILHARRPSSPRTLELPALQERSQSTTDKAEGRY